MAKVCAVCLLPLGDQGRLDEMRGAGVPSREILGWLDDQGHDHVTRDMLQHHYRGGHSERNKKAECPGTTDTPISLAPLEPYLADPAIGSTEATKRVIRTSLEQADRIRAFCAATFNLRSERVLNEVLQTVGRLLSDVDYEGEPDDSE